MTSTFKAVLCRLLAIAMMMLPFQTGQAAMIGSEQVNAAASVQLDRSVVADFLNRSQTVSSFQTAGVDTQSALERVAAMSDDEVAALAGKVNAVPAGGDGLVLLVLVVFFIWYFAFRR